MTGTIASIPPPIEQLPGNNSNNPASLPGLTYTAAIPTLPQTWTALQTYTVAPVFVANTVILALNSTSIGATDAEILIQKNGIPHWAFGTNVGTPGENFSIYSYGYPGVGLSINYTTGLVSAPVGISTPTVNNVTITAPAIGSTLTLLNGVTAQFNASITFTGQTGKTIAFDNTIEFAAGADNTVQTFPATSGTVVTSVTNAGGGLSGKYPNPTVASVPASAMPALTGDGTTAPGAVALTVTKINGIDQTTSWTTYAPAAAAQTPGATPPTFGTTTGRWKQIGKTIICQFNIPITAAGTGTGYLSVTTPATAAAFNYSGSITEVGNTGKGGTCTILSTDGAHFIIRYADATTVIASGNIIAGTITYEVP